MERHGIFKTYKERKACNDKKVRQTDKTLRLTFLSYFVFQGAVSDGEFNSLRTQGATRPVHLWQLIHDTRESVSRQSAKTLLSMLVKIGGELKSY